jgi:hypothetical protein
MSYRPPFFILFFEQKTKLFQAAKRTAAISPQASGLRHGQHRIFHQEMSGQHALV